MCPFHGSLPTWNLRPTVSRNSSHFCMFPLLSFILRFIPSSTQMCCLSSVFPQAAVIKASWPLFWACHPLHFCVGERERIRIRKIYHQQLKASWVWDLFFHNLKRLQANANRIQNTWRSGKTLKYKQELCKDKTKSGHLPASPKAVSSCRWFWRILNVVKRTCTWFP